MELNIGGKYNWKNQPERLIFIGRKHYHGDNRTWYQFAKIDTPEVVWCEVTDSELTMFEETTK